MSVFGEIPDKHMKIFKIELKIARTDILKYDVVRAYWKKRNQ